MKTNNACISNSELQQLIVHGEHITIIDVRSDDEFEKQHIPGAVHIPLTKIPTAVFQREPSQVIVTVCGKGGGRSQQAAELLKQSGYQAHWLCHGTDGWLKGI